MPTVYTEILASCKNTHHAKRYIKFIRACLDQNVTTTYHEAHHILPKSIWPKYKSFRECPWNKAMLTGRQHYIAHWMLARAFGGGMWAAFNAMCHVKNDRNKISRSRDFRISSTTYNELKTHHSEYQKVANKGEGNPFFGKKHSEETRKVMRANCDNKGENNPMFGRTGERSPLSGQKSDTHMAKIKASLALVEQVKCPHCDVVGKTGSMVRWHFDNCGKNSSMSGASNPRASRINIYNDNDSLMFECVGDFEKVCTDNNLPKESLGKSYRNGGKKLYQSLPAYKVEQMTSDGRIQFVGWYAVKV